MKPTQLALSQLKKKNSWTKTYILLILLLASLFASAQQQPPFRHTAENRVLTNRATQEQFFLALPSADVFHMPAYVPDSIKAKSLWIKTGAARGLYIFNPATGLIEKVGNYKPTTDSLRSEKLDKSGGTMTGSLHLYGDAVDALEPITKNQFDNYVTGITWKQEVKAATTANITLSGTQTVDGVSLVANDRVLVKNQAAQSQNGLYLVSSGAWTRPVDADAPTEIATSAVLVRLGTVNKNTQWTCTNITDPVIGTDAITYGQLSGAGTYTNGTGLTLSANVFDVNYTTLNSHYVPYAGATADVDLGSHQISATKVSVGGVNSGPQLLYVSGNLPASGLTKYYNTNNTGYSSNDFFDDTNALQLAFGYANTGASGALAGLSYFYSPNKPLVFFGASSAEILRLTSTGITAKVAASFAGSVTLGSTSTNYAHYNTVDQTTNFERVRQYWSGNVYNISVEQGGTGSQRNLNINAVNIFLTGFVFANSGLSATSITTANISSAVNGMLSFRSTNAATTSPTGPSIINDFVPQINQSGTAGYTAVRISPFESTIGSGTRLLFDIGTNSAANGTGTHTSKFTVDPTGKGIFSGDIISATRFGVGSAITGAPGAMVHVAGTFTTSGSFSGNGFGIRQDANIYTSTAVAGSPSLAAVNGFASITLAATNAQAITNAATIYIAGAPIPGTNTTITNGWGIYNMAPLFQNGYSLFNGTVALSSASTGFAHYNTVDQTTNYEVAQGRWVSGKYTISTEAGGTGTVRDFQIGTQDRKYLITQVGNPMGFFQYNGDTGVANASNVGLGGTIWRASSGMQNMLAIVPGFTQTGTAGYRGIWVSPFEGTLGSGPKYLIDLGTNTAALGAGTHTSKFTVDNVGQVNISGTLNGTSAIFSENVTTAGQIGASSSFISGSIGSYILQDRIGGNIWSTYSSGNVLHVVNNLTNTYTYTIDASTRSVTFFGGLNGTSANFSSDVGGRTFTTNGNTGTLAAGDHSAAIYRTGSALADRRSGMAHYVAGVEDWFIGTNAAHTDYNVTLAGAIKLNINGSSGTVTAKQFVSTSAAPTVTVGNASIVGTGATISISGNNQDGIITLTTGTNITQSGDVIFNVTMSGGFSYNQPTPVLTPNSGTATGLALYVGTAGGSFWYPIIFSGLLSPSTVYRWFYHCGGYQ